MALNKKRTYCMQHYCMMICNIDAIIRLSYRCVLQGDRVPVRWRHRAAYPLHTNRERLVEGCVLVAGSVEFVCMWVYRTCLLCCRRLAW